MGGKLAVLKGHSLSLALTPPPPAQVHTRGLLQAFLNKIAKTQAEKNSRNQNSRPISAENSTFLVQNSMSRNFYYFYFPKTPIFPPETQGFWPQNSSYRNSQAHSSCVQKKSLSISSEITAKNH